MNDRNKLIDIFMKKPIFYSYILVISAFVFLDYSVYAEIFHLHKASFIENYIYNMDIFSNEFLVGFVVLPILVIMSFGLIFYYFISEINKISDKIYNNKCEYFLLIFLLLSFLNFIQYSIFDKYNLFINGYSTLIYILIIIVVELFLLRLYIRYFSKYKNSYKFILFLLSFLVSIYCYYDNYKLINIFVVLFFFFLISLFVSYLIYEITKIKKTTKTNKSELLIAIILFSPLLFYWLNNNMIWNNLDTLSYNLILNNGYKSPNHHNIKVNVLGYNNNDANISKCQSFRDNKTYLDIKADTNTTYMPFFKHQKIYFVKKDENLTCVYVVKEKDDKYLLSEIGYIR